MFFPIYDAKLLIYGPLKTPIHKMQSILQTAAAGNDILFVINTMEVLKIIGAQCSGIVKLAT